MKYDTVFPNTLKPTTRTEPMKQRMRVVRPHATVLEPKPRSFGQTLVLIVLTLVVVVTTLSFISPDKKSDNPLASIAHKRTTEEMKAFWDRELNDLMWTQLVGGTLPYPEVNQHFAILKQRVTEQTGHQLNVNLSTNYHWAHTQIIASAGVNLSNNTRHVSLYIPAIMDTFDLLKSSGEKNWQAAFKSHMIVVFMHEMEHTSDNRQQTAIDIKEESRAWAETCRHTIVPLVDHHDVTLFQNEWNVYQAWRRAHGDTNNVYWLTMMQKLYGGLDGTSYPK